MSNRGKHKSILEYPEPQLSAIQGVASYLIKEWHLDRLVV